MPTMQDQNRVTEERTAEQALHALSEALLSLEVKIEERERHAAEEADVHEEEQGKDSPAAAAMRGKAKALHDARGSLHSLLYKHRITDAEWQGRQGWHEA